MLRQCGEANLIVQNQVDGASCAVAGQAIQVERLRHNALSRERRVAVYQHRQRDALVLPGRARLVALLTAGTGHSLHHRVDPLQMAGVRSQIHLYADFLTTFVCTTRAQMVLHIACPAFVAAAAVGDARRLVYAKKLGDDLLIGFAQNMRQHVEPAAVRHAQQDIARAHFRCRADELVQHRYHHAQPFQREADMPGESPMQEPLQRTYLGEAVEQRHFVYWVVGRSVSARFHRLFPPGALFRLLQMLELVAQRSLIYLTHPLDNRQRVGGACAEHAAYHVGG
ncbi:hypothetical protein HRbin16_02860 [bacterium HR16]|nr:hypothetical protein HRbin16_02860 [bacterium HR16]